MRLTVTAKPAPKAARLWVADGADARLPQGEMDGRPATIEKETVTGEVDAPKDGCLAFYVELDYEMDGIKYHLCTQLRVVGKAKGGGE